MQSSLFIFQYRISPWSYCLNLNFQNLKLLPERLHAVCTRDLFGIQGSTDPSSFESLAMVAHSSAATLLNAYSFFSFPNLPTLIITPVNWIEIKHTPAKVTTFGYNHESLKQTPLIPGHPDNEPFIKAGPLVEPAQKLPHLGLALSDFNQARIREDYYSAFYAFRVLEDVGNSFGRKNDRPDWDLMHNELGTSRTNFNALVKAGTISRHLQPIHDDMNNLISERHSFLYLTHELIAKWIKYLKLI